MWWGALSKEGRKLDRAKVIIGFPVSITSALIKRRGPDPPLSPCRINTKSKHQRTARLVMCTPGSRPVTRERRLTPSLASRVGSCTVYCGPLPPNYPCSLPLATTTELQLMGPPLSSAAACVCACGMILINLPNHARIIALRGQAVKSQALIEPSSPSSESMRRSTAARQSDDDSTLGSSRQYRPRCSSLWRAMSIARFRVACGWSGARTPLLLLLDARDSARQDSCCGGGRDCGSFRFLLDAR